MIDWTQFFKISLHFSNNTEETYDIGLSAIFRTGWESIQDVCQFKIGIVGGTLSLKPSAGHIPLHPRWPNGESRHLHDPTRIYRIHTTDSTSRPQWNIGYREVWTETYQNHCIDGLLIENRFARLVSSSLPFSIKANYQVEFYHLCIPHLNWEPFLKRHNYKNTISAKKHRVLTAFLRYSVHLHLGNIIDSIDLSFPEQITTSSRNPSTNFWPDIEHIRSIENVILKFLQSDSDSMDELVKLANLNSQCLRGICFNKMDLTNENLSGYHLMGSEFRYTHLDNAILNEAEFDCGDLRQTKLRECELNEAKLRYCVAHNADFDNAKLNKAELTQTNLTEAYMRNVELKQANLADAILEKADLSRSDLSNATLTDCKLDYAILNNTQLCKANFNNARLIKANINNADLRNAILEDADMQYIHLSNSDACGAILRRANLKNADFYDVDLSNADLEEADLTNAHFCRVNMSNAKLKGAILTNVILYDVDLSKASLEKATLVKANLSNVTLYSTDVKQAIFHEASFARSNLEETINRDDADWTNVKILFYDEAKDVKLTRNIDAGREYINAEKARLGGETVKFSQKVDEFNDALSKPPWAAKKS